jgi:hypothetical protein
MTGLSVEVGMMTKKQLQMSKQKNLAYEFN